MEKLELPPEVLSFLLHHIDSIGQLEALFLLLRNSGRSFTAASLAQSLYVSEELAAKILANMERRGMVLRSEDKYRYQEQFHAHELVVQLEERYARNLIAITELIHSKPTTRIQEFADAFRLRKDKK